MLRRWLGTTRSSSNTSFSPRPLQAGQAPCGALKENRRGSISAMVKPETGQANFSEKRMRPGGALSLNTVRAELKLSDVPRTSVRAELVEALSWSAPEGEGSPSTGSGRTVV